MPYIEPEKRPRYDVVLDQLPEILSKGDLEYCVFKVMLAFMRTREWRYTQLHDCVKGTEHSAHEMERRHLDKREDVAIQKNGDIEIPPLTSTLPTSPPPRFMKDSQDHDPDICPICSGQMIGKPRGCPRGCPTGTV